MFRLRTAWARRRAATGSVTHDQVESDLQTAVAQLQALQDAIAVLGAGIQRLEQSAKHEAAARILRNWAQDDDDLAPYEGRVLSQNGEDGVLVEILKRLGRRTGFFVEIGAHSTEANCLFLADALGFRGVFIDADERESALLGRKYASRGDVAAMCGRVTAENIDHMLETANVPRDFDVLSIDIDGNDYWLWEAIDDHLPAVVVIEYNAALPAAEPLVQTYDPGYVWRGGDRFGASLEAMRRLGERKGYRLVHADLTGVNLFFVHRTLWPSTSRAQVPVVRAPNYHLRLALHSEDDDAPLERPPDPQSASGRGPDA